MLSSQERRIWQEIERRTTEGTEGPARPGHRAPHRPRTQGHGVDDLPAAVVAGIWTSIVLVLVGFVLAGLAVGAVTTVLALLWRCWLLRRG